MAKKEPKYIMSVSELRELRGNKRDIDNTLRMLHDGTGRGTRAKEMIDEGRLKKQARMYEKKIAQHTPSKVSGVQKDKLAKEAKRLQKEIRQGMPTYDEMWNMKNNPGIPYKNLQWERRNANKIHRWKQIQRQLNPGDPTTSNVERLRRKK